MILWHVAMLVTLVGVGGWVIGALMGMLIYHTVQDK